MKEITRKSKFKLKWEKKSPPEELIQMARIKGAPKIHV